MKRFISHSDYIFFYIPTISSTISKRLHLFKAFLYWFFEKGKNIYRKDFLRYFTSLLLYHYPNVLIELYYIVYMCFQIRFYLFINYYAIIMEIINYLHPSLHLAQFVRSEWKFWRLIFKIDSLFILSKNALEI